MQVEEAQTWDFRAFECGGIEIAALEHGELLGCHFAAIGAEFAVEGFTNGVEIFFRLRRAENGDNFVFECGETAFEIFELCDVVGCTGGQRIECAGWIMQGGVRMGAQADCGLC